ncbi:unnamed protein product [Linum trigynum]|uniref:Cysteine proteinase inhibitor n=1 Tax=Linum trigynum TaxID=586398 RepID=A0AAV2EHI1_9ROSI
MTKLFALAAMTLVLIISVFAFVKPVTSSSCYRFDHFGPPSPMSHEEVQSQRNMRLARFSVANHNEVLSGAQRLKLVSVEKGAYYHVSPDGDYKSLDIIASNSFGQAKYRAFVIEFIAYDELSLQCFEKIY